MNDLTEREWIRLIDLFEGRLSPDLRAETEAWIDGAPVRRADVERLRAAWQIAGSDARPDTGLLWDSNAMWSEVARTLPQSRATSQPHSDRFLHAKRPILRATHRSRIGRAAIGVSAAAMLAFSVLLLGTGSARIRSSSAMPRATTIYQTRPGQRLTVQLGTRSVVVLGPASLLRVMHGVSGISANVQGEAYFDVAHDPRSSFTVNAGAATVRVLGTAFTVRRYPSDQATRVVVTDGRVSVGVREQSPVVLAKNMASVVDDSGRVELVPEGKLRSQADWAEGRLIFRNAPVEEIVAELSRAYGMSIKVPDTTLRRSMLTMTIPIANRPLRDVLTLMGLAVDAHVERTRDGFIVIPGDSKPAQPLTPRTSPTSESQYGR